MEDLESILGEETVMNLPTEHSVKWVYQMPPNVKLEMSKDSIGKIETENFLVSKEKLFELSLNSFFNFFEKESNLK